MLLENILGSCSCGGLPLSLQEVFFNKFLINGSKTLNLWDYNCLLLMKTKGKSYRNLFTVFQMATTKKYSHSYSKCFLSLTFFQRNEKNQKSSIYFIQIHLNPATVIKHLLDTQRWSSQYSGCVRNRAQNIDFGVWFSMLFPSPMSCISF